MFTPRYYQQESHDATVQFLLTQRGNPLVVLPTGAGKSVLIAMLARTTLNLGGRVLVLAHAKELLEQNAAKIAAFVEHDVGCYSAGLKSRDINQDVIVAGIQSVYDKPEIFGARHLIIVDEAHLVGRSQSSMYRSFLDWQHQYNPWVRTVGLTATPFRLDTGTLIDGEDALFNAIAYEAPLVRMIDDGFLCPITTQAAKSSIDTAGIEVRRGEFVSRQVEDEMMRKVQSACLEIAEYTTDRNAVLIFCSGITHANAVVDELRIITGDTVEMIDGSSSPLFRSTTLDCFKQGGLKYLVNVNVLTTGFDAPNIDCVAVLRSTMSAGLFAQMVGRGFRLHPSKTETLLLDFGGNLQRHGPLSSPDYGKKKEVESKAGPTDGETEPKPAGTKPCPVCKGECPSGNAFCPFCGNAFPFEARHEDKPDTTSSAVGESQAETLQVMEVNITVAPSKKSNAINMVVTYLCEDDRIIKEWVCLEHYGRARHMAQTWWFEHSIAPCPMTSAEGCDLWHRGALRMPVFIKVVKDGGFWRVLERQFEDEKPTTWSEAPVVDPFADEEIPF